MIINKNIKKAYLCIFENTELYFTNLISNIIELKNRNKYLDRSFKLSKEQVKEIQEFWKPYKRISTKWCKFYCSKNGNFSPMYIPNTLYYTKIDQYFNNRKLAWGFNDKNYYDKIFQNIPQPETVLRKVNGIILDKNYEVVSINKAIEILKTFDEIICKPSLETGSGREIQFYNTDKDIDKLVNILLDNNTKDIIIQDIIKQHPMLAEVHPSSINTIRVISILFPEKVYILSSVLRMGMSDSRVDNATGLDNSKFGGLSCGLDENGNLNPYGFTYSSGLKSDCHPDGYVFKDKSVPNFDKVIDLVQQAHQIIPQYRLVSWDISMDINGNPLLIEANMRKGGINFHQFNNGPLFGELTERVLQEVFRNND